MHADHAPPPAALAAATDRLLQSIAPRAEPRGGGDVELPATLPEDGLGDGAALTLLATLLLDRSTQLHHPGFFGHMDPPTPWITWITSLWTAALNQNLLHDDTAPTARMLERRVIDWLAPHFAMTGGHLVPGSTLANLTALWAARDLVGVERVVASDHAHLSVRKAAHVLGLEYAAVPTDGRRRLDPHALGDLRGAALILTAGTTATGAVDPLDAGEAASWRHVDAAWAGPLRLTDRHSGVLDGIEDADSVAFSAHKWCYQPKESAVVLFADAVSAHEALAFGGGYLADPNVGLLGSHGAAAASALAATLLSWGRRGLARRIEADMEKAAALERLIAGDERFESWAPHHTGIVVWRPRLADPDAVRDRMRGVYVSMTDIDGERWFRSVAANPGADPALVFAAAQGALG